MHLRNLDLNLLHPLHALLEERHVTRAAKRSFLSQPAISRTLDRVREMFGDPLLVRSGRGYQRTVRGERVLRELEYLMPRLEAMVRGEEFDPGRSRERFRVALTDHASMILMPSLVAGVRRVAPHVRLDVSMWRTQAYEDVAAGRLDTALSAEEPPPALQTEVLFHVDFVCLVGSAQRVPKRRFTLEQYLASPHVLVETLDGRQTLVDRPLAQLGAKRRAPLSLPFFVPAIFAIAQTDLILTVPRRLAQITAGMTGVRVVEPPREIKAFPYFMAWHPRLTDEPAHAWLREQLRTAARTI
ncbi:MAG TPA: LysR family transcriptional regulator [Bryobacteraceae bacterium]|nr:LysR family transcriptional regulator [Bryobacteraceae bacterium]